jgi:hypothetical protein
MVDEVTKKTLSNIPLLKTKASPRDGEQWRQRLKEELQSLIQVNIDYTVQLKIKMNIFSMLQLIRPLIMIGFVLNRTKKELVGGVKLGQFKTCYVMNSILNLMYKFYF